jgi:hypothetical protein
MARSAAARAEPAAPAKPRTTRAGTAAPPKPRAPRTAPRTAPAPRRRSGPAKDARGSAQTAPRAPLTGADVRRAVAARGNVLLDGLLRGRLWVGCVGLLLAGIVFLNVGLLQLNDQIARTDSKSAAIGRENAELRLELAKLDSTERIQRLAEAKGYVMPAPGAVRYVRARGRDAREAARRTVAPEPLTPVTPAAPVTTTPTTAPTTTAPTTAAPAAPQQTTPAPTQVTPTPAPAPVAAAPAGQAP